MAIRVRHVKKRRANERGQAQDLNFAAVCGILYSTLFFVCNDDINDGIIDDYVDASDDVSDDVSNDEILYATGDKLWRVIVNRAFFFRCSRCHRHTARAPWAGTPAVS